MKTILITIFFIFIGVTAKAQNALKESKVAATQMTIVTFPDYTS